MAPSSSPPAVLCVGIAVQDIVFRVAQFPPPGGKCMTNEFAVVAGGCAVNAAIAVARLGGKASYAGPLGHPGDTISNQLIDQMTREGVGTLGVVRVPEATAPVSGIMVDGCRRADDRDLSRQADRERADRRPRPSGRRHVACCSPTIAFRISCGRSAKPRGGAAFRWCSTPTVRRSRTIRCSSFRPMWCSRRNACAPPRARTISPRGCCG